MYFYFTEQARREIEAEMKLKESGQAPETRESVSDAPGAVMPEREIDPGSYAVQGIFYTCPLIGNKRWKCM